MILFLFLFVFLKKKWDKLRFLKINGQFENGQFTKDNPKLTLVIIRMINAMNMIVLSFVLIVND